MSRILRALVMTSLVACGAEQPAVADTRAAVVDGSGALWALAEPSMLGAVRADADRAYATVAADGAAICSGPFDDPCGCEAGEVVGSGDVTYLCPCPSRLRCAVQGRDGDYVRVDVLLAELEAQVAELERRLLECGGPVWGAR